MADSLSVNVGSLHNLELDAKQVKTTTNEAKHFASSIQKVTKINLQMKIIMKYHIYIMCLFD